MNSKFMTASFMVLLCAVLVVLQPTASCAPGKDGNGPQEKKDKKVLTTTKDSKGFHKELTEVDMMYQTAKQFMSAQQWDQAIEALEKVVTADRERIQAYRDLADCYDELKAPDKAAESYRRAVEVSPEDKSLLSLLGYAELRAKEIDNAVLTYTRMAELDSLDYDANVHLGFICQKKGELDKAVIYYKKALKSNPEDVPTMGSIAKIYTDQGKLDNAIEMYTVAVASAPDDKQKANLQSKLGAAYITSKDFTKSAEVFESLTVLEPDKPAHHYNLGISYIQLKKPNDAIPPLTKVIELKPDFAAAYQQLGSCYNDVKQYGKAIETIKKGIAVTDVTKQAGLHVTHAKSLEKLKRFDEAIFALRKAVNDPQYGDYAKKEIARQGKLKEREEKIKEQQ
jgi:tetratricopeptide (TPR) repeat protein